MNSSISILLSTLKAILPFSYMAGPSVPFRQISTPGNQVKLRYFSQCLYFCSTLFCLLVIITLLLRRCTSWRQCHRSLSQSFHHSFPWANINSSCSLRIKCVYGHYLTLRQICSSTCSSKMDAFPSSGWRISSKSAPTSYSFILFFFYFLKIFTCCFYVVFNVSKKAVEKVIYRLSA